MQERTVITEVRAGGADQDPVVNPVVDLHADAQQLTFMDAVETAILNINCQTVG